MNNSIAFFMTQHTQNGAAPLNAVGQGAPEEQSFAFLNMMQNMRTQTAGALTEGEETSQHHTIFTGLPQQSHIRAQQEFLGRIERALERNQGELDALLKGMEGILTTDALQALESGNEIPATSEIFLPNITLQDFKAATQALFDKKGGLAITLNLTPEQITQLGEQGHDELTNDEAFALMLVQMLPPKARQEFILQNNLTPQQTEALNLLPELGARMNMLQRHTHFNDEENAPPLNKDAKFQWGAEFKNMVAQQASNGKADFGLSTAQQASQNGAQHAAQAQASSDGQSSTLQGWPFEMTGSLLQALGWSDASLDNLNVAAHSSHISNSVSSMTNISTFAPSATQPHPSTALVAMTMNKAAASGETKSLSLQLDPPELGRVEVKMTFEGEKKVKALLTAEKPETLVMLQRDAATLERALQDAGLELDNNSLSFEMAQDDQFGQNGGHDGSRNEARGNNAAGGEVDDTEIISSTMTWHVDPDSGQTRYDILA